MLRIGGSKHVGYGFVLETIKHFLTSKGICIFDLKTELSCKKKNFLVYRFVKWKLLSIKV